MDDEAREDWLQERQDGRVYPLGRVLRDTFHADNHETLGSDVAGLMIDLSKVPYEPAAALPVASHPRPSIMARIGSLFGRR